MNASILTLNLQTEDDVVAARQRARLIAGKLGLSQQQQTAVATAVSELARNAVTYGRGGAVEYSVHEVKPRALLQIEIRDSGPGIRELKTILDGLYKSQTGMGVGILGSQRLSDEFDIQTAPGDGTRVTIGFRLPKQLKLSPPLIAEIAQELAATARPANLPLSELQQQNRELLAAMQTLVQRQAEVDRLNAELSETNSGVLALYAELDERAASLRAASEYKTRFLSDMTHELRTPLNAMISLGRLLLDRTDGPLTDEQEKQVKLIHRSATSLSEMVNDLLDIAKIEAGKTEVHATNFTLTDLLAAQRGMFRPLFASLPVNFIVEEGPAVEMHSDEQKIAQILRNLISNAMKFTEQGEVRVQAEQQPDGQVRFTVVDTGIGIAEQHLSAIFDDFTQIGGARQRMSRGTGLGLPLTRKLCRLLGGDVSVCSTLGEGTTFTVLLPRIAPAAENAIGRNL